MGTISQKLTYLNDTKQLLKENINNLGGNLTNEPFRQYVSVLEGIYESLPKVSGIGASLSLSPSMVGKIKLNEIQGDTLQDGTPTPSSPVPIQSVTGLQNVEVCGKNLFDKSNANIINANLNNNTINIHNNERTVWFKCEPNTTYTFTKLVATPYSRNAIAETTVIPAENVSIQNRYTSVDSSVITYTTSSTAQYIVWWFYSTGSTNYTQQQVLDSMQIEKNNQATTYEPYKGNTYEVNLGKNLIETSLEIMKAKNTTGTWNDNVYSKNGITIEVNSDNSLKINNTSTGAVTFLLTYTHLLKKGTYTISGLNSTDGVSLYVWDSSWNNIAYTTSSYSFTINEDKIFMVGVTIASGKTFNNLIITPQLEKGNATSYSPYFTPIELNKIGNYEDRIYKDNGKWYVEKNIGKVVLNGSNDEKWGTWFSTTGVYYSANYISSLTDSADTINCICDKYQANTRAYLRNNLSTIDNVCATNGGELILANKSITSVSDFKNWLSNNNVIMYYVYARSVAPKIVITNTELIEQLETLYNAKSEDGTTNINVTSEDLSMILNVGVLKGE